MEKKRKGKTLKVIETVDDGSEEGEALRKYNERSPSEQREIYAAVKALASPEDMKRVDRVLKIKLEINEKIEDIENTCKEVEKKFGEEMKVIEETMNPTETTASKSKPVSRKSKNIKKDVEKKTKGEKQKKKTKKEKKVKKDKKNKGT